MSRMTPEQRAMRDSNPNEMSPRLRIDREDSGLALGLIELRNRMFRKNLASCDYRAPEVRYEYADVHGPTIINALLERGEVNLWELSRQSPGYPESGGMGFNMAVETILNINGVKLIKP